MKNVSFFAFYCLFASTVPEGGTRAIGTAAVSAAPIAQIVWGWRRGKRLAFLQDCISKHLSY